MDAEPSILYQPFGKICLAATWVEKRSAAQEDKKNYNLKKKGKALTILFSLKKKITAEYL
jgi:hypothetical protein